jgi:hypothetical protein
MGIDFLFTLVSGYVATIPAWVAFGAGFVISAVVYAQSHV